MSSIARHHAEWLSLLEISGPFLSLSVLKDVFPQGLEADDPALRADLRPAYEEWLDNQRGLRSDARIHRAWVHWVFRRVLDFVDDSLWWRPEGHLHNAWPQLAVPEQDETIAPDLVIVEPPDPFAPTPGPRQPRLLVMILPPDASPDRPPPGSRWQTSAATRMMMLLHAAGVRLGMITNGEQWMLVDAPAGGTTAFISWYASLWLEEPITLRAFRTLLGSRRFFAVPENETLEALLARSAEDQQEVTDQLGAQARHAVELLVQTLDRKNQDAGGELLAGVDQETLYEAAVTVMMRLIFLLAAEERELLLLGDPIYDQNYAVSTLRGQLLEQAQQQGEDVLERRFDAWYRLLATFRAVHDGVNHDRMHLPAYGGGLFDPDRFPFLEGRKVSRQNIPSPARRGGREGAIVREIVDNRTVLHLLDALQTLRVRAPGGGPTEARRVSFRALDVEQIGHVYESLLDHTVRRADDVILGLRGTKHREPEVPLTALEERRHDSKALIDYLEDATGRSSSALENALNKPADGEWLRQIRLACNHDETLFQRVLPFANLLRTDDYDRPVIILPGSLYVTAGASRRASGSHYTPRALTEPIVRHALEPLVYDGPAQGKPRDQWRLRPPEAILNLKVCDMAMGSGAFLAQACRYLGERLVEAWEQVESYQLSVNSDQSDNDQLMTDDWSLITPLGKPAHSADEAIPANPDDRLNYARRLVADRCLYGVDKNPMAVEMAKLSLWLVTLDRGRPFTFLDHALKAGDSIIGADEDMLLRWVQTLPGPSAALYLEEMQKAIARAQSKRRELEAFTVRDIQDAEIKAMLLAEADEAMAQVKLGADLLVGTYLLGLSDRDREALQARLLVRYQAGELDEDKDAQRALAAARQHRAFHWPFEFPEVFLDKAQGGFDAFIGNPPFIGGKRISTVLGNNVHNAIKLLYEESKGAADYVAYFFRRAYNLLRAPGYMGMIATNSIAEADTREVGLEHIIKKGGTIYRATPMTPWPGEAGVSISIIHITKGHYSGVLVLGDEVVKKITPQLDVLDDRNPYRLATFRNQYSQGPTINGRGFIITHEEYLKLIKEDIRNKEVLFPYINGQILNSIPTFDEPKAFVINFHDFPKEKAQSYHGPFQIIEERVKPKRESLTGQIHEHRYWIHWDRREGFFQRFQHLDYFLVSTITTKFLTFSFLPKHWYCSHAIKLFGFDSHTFFAVLQSSIHEGWARRYSSQLETRLRYSTSDAFDTFPFPQIAIDEFMGKLEKKSSPLFMIGATYYEYRAQVMRARGEGLTKTYNRFHDPNETAADIARLRELHVAMDEAVAAAYGWEDIDLGHDFHDTPQGLRYTISEPARRELLARLLELNHQRHEEEVARGQRSEDRGRKSGGRKKKRKPANYNNEQMTLF